MHSIANSGSRFQATHGDSQRAGDAGRTRGEEGSALARHLPPGSGAESGDGPAFATGVGAHGAAPRDVSAHGVAPCDVSAHRTVPCDVSRR